jgi:hypothetical protein
MRAFNHLMIAIVAGLSLAVVPGNAIAAASPTTQNNLVKAAAGLPNGIYLYGQTTKADQLNQAYFVFEVRQSKVLGALYMPQSSFDCAYGGFQRDQLALSVVDSYEKTIAPYAIALDRTAKVAANKTVPLNAIGLEGFQKLATVSANDLKILNTCKTMHQAKVW